MKLYKQVCIGSLENVVGYCRDRLVMSRPMSVGTRYSSNIHCHINERAGWADDRILVDIEAKFIPFKNAKGGRYVEVP